MKNMWPIIVVLLLASCASDIPSAVSRVPPGNLTLAEIRSEPTRFVGSTVRLGGVINSVENKASRTWIEVVSLKLKKNGRPREDGYSDGRFIASFYGFVDPIIYSAGQLLTVVGTIEGETARPIGEYEYSFPIVAVTSSYLWPPEPIPVMYDYPPPWWYDDPWPFYHPFYRPYPPYRW